MTEVIYCANGCTKPADVGERTPVQTEPPSLLCRRCENDFLKWLDGIPDRYAQLPRHLLPGTTEKNPDSKATKAAHAPTPVSLNTIDLMDERLGRRWQGTEPSADRRGILGLLLVHTERLRDERTLRTDLKPTVAREAATLRAHFDWLTQQAWVTDVHADCKIIFRTLGDAIGIHRQKPVGKCPVDTDDGLCAGPLLASPYGSVFCPKCQATWDANELRRLGLVLATTPVQETA